MVYKCFLFAGNVRDVGFDTGNIHPMLVQCEPIVSDTGSTLYQHWERLVFAGPYYITVVKKCYVKGSDPALNQCSHSEHVFAVSYLLISPPLILYTLGAFSQRWGNVLKRT